MTLQTVIEAHLQRSRSRFRTSLENPRHHSARPIVRIPRSRRWAVHTSSGKGRE